MYFRLRYAILFYSLLITLVAVPIFGALGRKAYLLEILLAANLLAAVVPIGSRLARRGLLGLLGVAWAVAAGAAWLGEAALVRASFAIWGAIALVAAVVALRFAVKATRIDREHVYAALSAYVLAGIYSGVFYWVLERTWPGSLAVAGEPVNGSFTLSNGIYFSFVTLATLGYGDIVPRSDVARGLAVVETVSGQLYLAVMIARLVSLYGARGEHK